MSQNKTDMFIFKGLLFVTSLVLLLTAGQDNIEIHLHDTYFSFGKTTLAILIFGTLSFSIYLIRALKMKFKKVGANIGLVVGLIFVSLIALTVIQLNQGILDEIIQPYDEQLIGNSTFIEQTRTKIHFSVGVFSICVVGILFLIYRTLTLLNHPSNNLPSNQKRK